MAFIDIPSSKERDRIVADYVETLKNYKEDQIQTKTLGLEKKKANEQTFQPIVKATQDSTKAITSLLKKPDPSIFRSYVESNRKDLDRYYSIYKRGDDFIFGDKGVKIENNNIVIDGFEFKGTEGLWNLVMLNKPEKFTDDDLTNYLNLIQIADVYDHPRQLPNSKPSITTKARFLRSHIYEEPSDDDDDEFNSPVVSDSEKEGTGFLPSNINSLAKRLAILLAERRAGNTLATTSELVAILDELLRRRKITQKDYNAICKAESC